jgi:hypothetical protein
VQISTKTAAGWTVDSKSITSLHERVPGGHRQSFCMSSRSISMFHVGLQKLPFLCLG